MNFTYHIPTRIFFGPGELEKLGSTPLPGSHCLLVISAGGSMKRNGYLDRVTTLLEQNSIQWTLFDKIQPNPTLDHVTEGAALAQKKGCDFIIGLGGGSSLDSAKSIAIMAKNPGNYWDYIHGGSGKGLPVTEPVLPIVAITTTAGTGTEADPWTVITNEEKNEKIGFGLLPQTFPEISIVDPELMLTIPPALTAFQGFDAFFHAAEGVIANIATPVSDAYALKSIELLSQYLPVAVEDGSNLEARTQVALANTLSGFVESTSSCTSEHSMEHALSAYYPALPHGAGLIILSEAYFAFFADKAPEQFMQMAKAMGAEDVSSPMDFVEQLILLQKKCGVDDLKMSDYGIQQSDIPQFAENSFSAMGGLFQMDRYQLSMDDVQAIFQKSYS